MPTPTVSHTALRLAGLLACCALAIPSGLAARTASQNEAFAPLTTHIQKQIHADKNRFLDAQTCTEWFYKQLYQKPPKPTVEGIAFRPGAALSGDAADCRARYPGGLDAAREDFSRTQSLLSISLTFYELVLVGDRNDDQVYSPAELRDMLESFGLPFDAALTPAAHAATLQATFDNLHRTGGMESLMASMGTLYDKGYRLTGPDRSELNRVMG